MKAIEFHTRPDGDVEFIIDEQSPAVLKQTDTDLIMELYNIIMSTYPEAHAALYNRYYASLQNHVYFRFLVVRGFAKCNFGQFDNKADIDEEGNFHFEFVPCPLRGECKDENIICSAKPRSILSAAEIKVLELISIGKEAEEIADMLFISKHTVDTHRKNMQKKLDIHNVNGLSNYYHKIFRPR